MAIGDDLIADRSIWVIANITDSETGPGGWSDGGVRVVSVMVSWACGPGVPVAARG